MKPHWAVKYIGKPWGLGARGPDAFDCWGLVWWIQRYEFGRDIPSFPIPDPSVVGVVDPDWANKVAGVKHQLRDWVQVSEPNHDGDVVLMNGGHHAGIFLRQDSGMILHTMATSLRLPQTGSAVAQPLHSIRQLCFCRQLEFYHFNGLYPSPV